MYYSLMRTGPYVLTGFLVSGLFLLLVTAPRLRRAGAAGLTAALGIGWAYVAIGIVGLAAVVITR